MFILRPFFYSISYLSRYTTSYNCASFTMLIWSYHLWFGYPFIMLPMREWLHSNPWYVSRYPCNYCIEKWSPHTKRSFSPFPPPHTKTQVDIVITRDNFRTLADVVIVDLTHPNLVQCASTTIVHAATIVAQNRAWSYKEQVLEDDSIPIAIETYGCLHLCFDSFLTSCVHVYIVRHQ
jgi:hypothetical protein